jgi:WYL domain
MSLFHWFAGDRDEQWRSLITDRPVHAQDEDSGEMVEIKPTQDNPNEVEGLLIGFCYVDAVGNSSKRDLLCWRCWQAHGVVYLRGYCTLRQELRTFRTDRMTEAIEVRTKNSIDDPVSYFARFADHEGDAAYESRRTGFTGNLRSDWLERSAAAHGACIDGIRVISYIAAAHGGMTKDGEDYEGRYIQARLDAGGLSGDRGLYGSMMKMAKALTVPSSTYSRAVNAVAAEKENFQMVCAVISKIADDVATNPAELEVAQQLLTAGEKRGWV